MYYAAERHFRDIRNLTTPSPVYLDNLNALNSLTEAEQKALSNSEIEVLKNMRNDVETRAIIRKALDRPNLRRPLAFLTTTLPMFSHVSDISEIPFEKAHKHLKRFVARSHGNNLQRYISEQVRLGDWRSRLANVLTNFPDNNFEERSAYCSEASRFLCMREKDALFKPRSLSYKDVIDLLGPAHCVLEVLLEQRHFVTGTNPERAPYMWNLAPPTSSIQNGTWNPTPCDGVLTQDWPTVLFEILAYDVPDKAYFSLRSTGT